MRNALRHAISVAAAVLISGGASQVATSQLLDQAKVSEQPIPQTLTQLKESNRKVRVPVRTGSVVLHIYVPQPTRPDAPLVIYSSGSGGWHQFDDYIATAFAQRGMPVCGISMHSYLRKFYNTSRPATSDEIIADYRTLTDESTKVIGVNQNQPLILSGWSLGAGYAVLVASDPLIKPRVRGVISISLTRDNETALSLTNRLLSRAGGKTVGPSFDVTEYLSKLSPLPVAIIQAGKDPRASPKVATGLIESASRNRSARCRLFDVEAAHGHSFSGARSDFDRALNEALQWIFDSGCCLRKL
jgi:type IV secretory pathway VirJ component